MNVDYVCRTSFNNTSATGDNAGVEVDIPNEHNDTAYFEMEVVRRNAGDVNGFKVLYRGYFSDIIRIIFDQVV